MSAQPQLRESSAFDASTAREHPVRMKVKQRASDDDRGTIMVVKSDPFQSLLPWDNASERRGQTATAAPRVVSAPTMKYVAREQEETVARPAHRTSEFLRPSVAEPIKLPRAFESAAPSSVSSKPQAKTSNARDAWCAVALMGMFIVGGIAWTSNRILNDDTMIADLRTQLDQANATIDKKLAQIKELYQRVTDAENNAAKAQANLARAKGR